MALSISLTSSLKFNESKSNSIQSRDNAGIASYFECEIR